MISLRDYKHLLLLFSSYETFKVNQVSCAFKYVLNSKGLLISSL
jgi:hypothetical protein